METINSYLENHFADGTAIAHFPPCLIQELPKNMATGHLITIFCDSVCFFLDILLENVAIPVLFVVSPFGMLLNLSTQTFWKQY